MEPPFDPDFPPWQEDFALLPKASPQPSSQQDNEDFKRLAEEYDIKAPRAIFFDEKEDVDTAIMQTKRLQSVLYQSGGGYSGWIVDTAILCLVKARSCMIDETNITAFIFPIPEEIVRHTKKAKREIASDLVNAMRRRMTYDPQRSRASLTNDDNVMVVWQRIDPEEPETNKRLLLIWEAKIAKDHRFERAKIDGEICLSCLAQRGLRLVQSCCTCARSLWIKQCQLFGAHVPDGITEADVRQYVFEHKRKQANDARIAAQIVADATPIPTKVVEPPEDA